MQPREVLSVDEIDLSDLEFWIRPWDEREGAFATLRRERPLAFFEEPDIRDASPFAPPPGPGYRAVTRYADVAEISRHPEIYRSGTGAVSILDMPPEMVEYFSGMISTDSPRHARLRRIVSAAFNPRMVKSIEDHIQDVAVEVVDRMQSMGTCDFVTEVAARLPLRVICEMMGIAEADYDTVFRCSNVILSNADPEYVPEDVDPVGAFLAVGQELTTLMEDLATYRLEHPTDDITTALITTNIDGEALTHAELASFFILLVVAGNETTRNAITHGLWALAEHPAQRAVWMENVSTVTPTAVDEIVRWASPVIWMRRTVAEDTSLAGQELHPGDKMILFYNSANRDETVFDDPFEFDVRRNPNPHVGFGAPGPHFCLGAHLARREISVMFKELFARLPGIEVIGEPDRLRSNFINGIKHLPCRIDSGRT
ncbi:MAG: cytochrome P450 [Actinomycetota bacterium]|jgi:cytochrome P450|nr:cytochrome P450 [Actinomycetota bacterium]